MTLKSLHRKVRLRHGKSKTFKLRFKVTSSLVAGNYKSFFSITIGDMTTTAVGDMFTI